MELPKLDPTTVATLRRNQMDLAMNLAKQHGYRGSDEKLAKSAQELLENLGETPILSLVTERDFPRRALIYSMRLLFEEEAEQYKVPAKADVTTKLSEKSSLFVVGLPRTGTTLLLNLLRLDTNCKNLVYWQMRYPTTHQPIEVNKAKTGEFIDKYFAKLKEGMIHHTDIESPEEDYLIFDQSHFDLTYILFGGPEYFQFEATNKRSFELLDLHRRYIQYYVNRDGVAKSHWIFKTPFFLFLVEEILAIYPDANIVWTHRDPKKVIASFSLLTSTVATEVPKLMIGPIMLQVWSGLLKKGLRDRMVYEGTLAALPEPPKIRARFLDIFYEETLEKPVETVKKIYDFYGYDFSAPFQKDCEDYLAQHPKGHKGAYSYNLEEFGVTGEAVDKEFEFYYQAFPQIKH